MKIRFGKMVVYCLMCTLAAFNFLAVGGAINAMLDFYHWNTFNGLMPVIVSLIATLGLMFCVYKCSTMK